MVKIFCEGITDQIFLADFIEVNFGYQFKRYQKKDKTRLDVLCEKKIEIIEIGGCNKLKNQIYIDSLADNFNGGGINIVIFDADHKAKGNGNKGFENCKNKLENLKLNKSVQFEYFIWPNYEDEGEIEDLLRKLIPKSREDIFNCIDSHQDCISKLKHENLKYAELKEKVGYYLFTCNMKSPPKDRDYKDKEYWNLKLDDCNDLKKLHKFLKPIIDKL